MPVLIESEIYFHFFIFIKLPFCRQWLLCSFRGAALRRSGSGTCEGFQRIEGLCIAVGAFDDNLKVRQYFFHGLVEHTLFGDGRVLDIFLVHSVKTRNLCSSLIDALGLLRLSVFDDTVGLCLRQRKLFIAVLIGIVQGSFFSLLAVSTALKASMTSEVGGSESWIVIFTSWIPISCSLRRSRIISLIAA